MNATEKNFSLDPIISVQGTAEYVINQQHIRERANKSVIIPHNINAKTNERVISPHHKIVTNKRQFHWIASHYCKVRPKFLLLTIISMERITELYISPHRTNARNNQMSH